MPMDKVIPMISKYECGSIVRKRMHIKPFRFDIAGYKVLSLKTLKAPSYKELYRTLIEQKKLLLKNHL